MRPKRRPGRNFVNLEAESEIVSLSSGSISEPWDVRVLNEADMIIVAWFLEGGEFVPLRCLGLYSKGIRIMFVSLPVHKRPGRFHS